MQDQQQQAPARGDFPIRLSLWADNKLLVFDPKEEIYLIKTDAGKKIQIYTSKGILESNLPLKVLEEKLNPCGFLRTHKSYIVNMNKVREIIPWFNDTYILTVENCPEKEIPVSRHFIHSFKNFLNL